MMIYLLLGFVVLSITGLLFGGAMLLLGGNEQVEDRLTSLTQNKGRGHTDELENRSLLKSPLNDAPNQVEEFFSRFLNVRLFIEQSGLKLDLTKFCLVSLLLGGGAAFVAGVLLPWKSLAVVAFAIAAPIPLGYVWWIRRGRLAKFGKQLVDALDLISQALRAGQSLPAGIQLVAEQMSEPIGPEFNRAYEQQNLGVTLEKSLLEMCDRIPNLDLKFFATSVVLQRQTGGDLAEILDKIGHLIRERLKIHGQIQALTGEGRLSGIVLLALPPALFGVMLRLNYDYVMMLFNDPLGQKMLIFGIVMQFLGAAAIKEIITIKV